MDSETEEFDGLELKKAAERLVEAVRLNDHLRLKQLMKKYEDKIVKVSTSAAPDGYSATTSVAESGNTMLLEKFHLAQVPLHWSDGFGWNALHYACRSGRLETVKFLIEIDSINLDYKTRDGWTALQLSVVKNHVSIAELLIRRRCDVNVKGPDDWTALHFTIFYGHVDILKHLLFYADKRLDLNVVTSKFQSIIELAICENKMEILSVLLSHENDIVKQLIQTPNQNGLYPIHYATLKSNIKAIEILLENGADINQITGDETQETCLHIAVEKEDIPTIKFFLKKNINLNAQTAKTSSTSAHYTACIGNKSIMILLTSHHSIDFSIPDNKGNLILHTAIENKQTTLANYLLNIGQFKELINFQNEDKMTPLILTAVHNLVHVANEILNFENVDCNLQDIKNRTVLHHAANTIGMASVLRNCIKAGGGIWLEDQDGRTALHIAARKCNFDCVNVLLIAGATINCRCAGNLTALHLACGVFNNRKVIELLLKNNANINAEDDELWRPIHHAAYYGAIDACKVLLDMGASVDCLAKDDVTPLYLAVTNGHEDIIKLLLDNGASINKHTENGHWTPLHVATEKDKLECVKILISKGAIINSWSKTGDLPLHTTARWGLDVILLEFLQYADADTINSANTNGLTPLMLSTRYGHTECVRILLCSNADANKKDLEGDLAIHVAIRHNHTECVEILVKYSDLSALGCGGWNCLHLAASLGNNDALKILLDSQQNIDLDETTRDDNQLSPVFLAAAAMQYDCVELLVKAGAKTNLEKEFPSKNELVIIERLNSFLKSIS